MRRTPQQWADLTRSVTRNLTDQQIIDVAMACFYEDARNPGFAAVWHEMAQTLKTRCNCARCA
jgi:hypothetical protein